MPVLPIVRDPLESWFLESYKNSKNKKILRVGMLVNTDPGAWS